MLLMFLRMSETSAGRHRTQMNDLDADYQAALKRLGYTEEWIDGGILDRQEVIAQFGEIERSEADPHAEHYRHGALQRFLRARKTLTVEELASLLRIARNELTKALSGSVYHDLAKHPGLTDSQFQAVVRDFDDADFQKIAARETLRRRARREEQDSDLIEEVLQMALGSHPAGLRDSELERWLVDTADLTEAQLNRLETDASRKTIRKLAEGRLRQRHT